MPQKAQHSRDYQVVQKTLRDLRTRAGLTQRELGDRLKKPQSWVYNCETGNRRVDIAEFIQWCEGCGANPIDAMRRVMAKS